LADIALMVENQIGMNLKRNRDYLNVSRDVRPRSAQIPDMARPFLFYKGNYEVYKFASVQIQQRV
jgi:hypothetical protein